MLKKPEMSKSKRALTDPVACMAWIQWTRVVMVSIAVWWGQDPNCVMGSKA